MVAEKMSLAPEKMSLAPEKMSLALEVVHEVVPERMLVAL
jgi:hypothetical protein